MIARMFTPRESIYDIVKILLYLKRKYTYYLRVEIIS